ncbi:MULTISPECIES: elongation factor P-like protein EfpL [Aliivibrio]|uniref:Elongation factor P-like protein n=1 Tax=Aliivibrio logei TaxID=688 RepID=A0A1B9P0F2_ALILO|nr:MULTISPECIES: elongation factor P-like protein YeiP [Aliivibrio]MBB1315970.1 elongation factor P-like protein YeiP [Aliivibrio sp. SR45-2]OCH21839.1 elongation factor P-like protein YeiP [Aliivibrio logei]
MPKASDIKKGSAIEHNGKVYFVKEITKLTPSGRAGATLFRMRMYDVATGSKADESFKTDEIITLADFSRRSATFSYVDGNEYVFMDSEDYTPYTFNKEAIEEELLFISEDTQGLQILIVDGVPVAIELPSAVDLEIVDTAPSIKGASASARTKPATMTTGLTVQVPEYIANGEKVKINTAEHKFMSRA